MPQASLLRSTRNAPALPYSVSSLLVTLSSSKKVRYSWRYTFLILPLVTTSPATRTVGIFPNIPKTPQEKCADQLETSTSPPSPGKPRAFELLKIGLFKFPPPMAKLVFKCPTLSLNLSVKCPS